MDFTMSDEVKLMMESVRDWFNRHLPLEKVKEVDQAGHPMPKEVVEGLAGLGVIMGTVPEEHGGQGLDWFTQAAIAEEIGYGDPTAACAAAFMAVMTGWGFTLDRYASEAIRKDFVIPGIEERTGVAFEYVPVLLGGVFKLTNNVMMHIGVSLFLPCTFDYKLPK